MILTRPISTLFPYTTLFRSINYPYGRTQRQAGRRDACPTLGRRLLGQADIAVERLAAADDVEGHLVHPGRSEEHTSELQSRVDLVCRLLLEKKNRTTRRTQG